ncbi:MAG: RsiV family protein [Ignavibacteriaceae bacterium]|nr:RsiV family protein [Ignavibacteriaceae bacterium]
MTKICVLLLLISLLFPAFSNLMANTNVSDKDSVNTTQTHQLNLPKYFYKRFEGTTNNEINIVMNLIRRNNLLTGSYYYVANGKPIIFNFKSRITNNGRFYLAEYSGQYDIENIPEISGEFSGEFINDHSIVGTWKSPQSAIKYHFELVESYPAGSVRLNLKNYAKNYYYKNRKAAAINFIFTQLYDYLDKKTEDSINYGIAYSFIKNCSFQDSSKSLTSFESVMDNFVKQYKGDEIDTTSLSDYFRKWENYYSNIVLFNSNNILAIENIDYFDCGGAHSSANYIYQNFNVLTGRTITLSELLKPNFKELLDRIGWYRFYETYNNQDPPAYKIDEFHLNDNFSISKLGLTFKFEEYEISSYSFGAPEVFIPYSDMKDLIKPDGLLAQFIK